MNSTINVMGRIAMPKNPDSAPDGEETTSSLVVETTPEPVRLTTTEASSGSFDGISKLSVNNATAVGANRIVMSQTAIGANTWPEHASA